MELRHLVPLKSDARKVAYAMLETKGEDPFPKGGSLLAPEVHEAWTLCIVHCACPTPPCFPLLMPGAQLDVGEDLAADYAGA